MPIRHGVAGPASPRTTMSPPPLMQSCGPRGLENSACASSDQPLTRPEDPARLGSMRSDVEVAVACLTDFLTQFQD